MQMPNDFVISEAVELVPGTNNSSKQALYHGPIDQTPPNRVWPGPIRALIWIIGVFTSWGVVFWLIDLIFSD